LARDELNEAWNGRLRDDEDLFDTWVETKEDGARELWCSFEHPLEDRERLEQAAARFVLAFKEAQDACVLATANATSRWVWPTLQLRFLDVLNRIAHR